MRDLVRRDDAASLWSFLEGRWTGLLGQVRADTPLGRDPQRLGWTAWLDDPAALALWARGAELSPGRAALPMTTMSPLTCVPRRYRALAIVLGDFSRAWRDVAVGEAIGHALAGMEHGGVVATAKGVPDRVQGGPRDLAGEIDRKLPRPGDA